MKHRLVRNNIPFDRDLTQAALTLEHLATRHIAVVAHLNTEIEAIVWPQHQTEEGGKSANSDWPVERAARSRALLVRQRDQIINARADILAAIDALAYGLRQGERLHAPNEDKAPVRLCSGHGIEGAELTWTPHSRQPDNGWHDPTCVDPADESGLCAKCRIRERRWRDEHGLPARKTNAGIGAREVV